MTIRREESGNDSSVGIHYQVFIWLKHNYCYVLNIFPEQKLPNSEAASSLLQVNCLEH